MSDIRRKSKAKNVAFPCIQLCSRSLGSFQRCVLLCSQVELPLSFAALCSQTIVWIWSNLLIILHHWRSLRIQWGFGALLHPLAWNKCQFYTLGKGLMKWVNPTNAKLDFWEFEEIMKYYHYYRDHYRFGDDNRYNASDLRCEVQQKLLFSSLAGWKHHGSGCGLRGGRGQATIRHNQQACFWSITKWYHDKQPISPSW